MTRRVLLRLSTLAAGLGLLAAAATAQPMQPVRLSDTAVAGGGVLSGFQITPDGSRVVYRGNLTTADVFEMYSASTTVAGTQIKLSSVPVAGGDVDFFEDILFTPDSTRVVYIGDLTTDEVSEIYSASTNAIGTQIRLNETPVAGGELNTLVNLQITPDGSRIVYNGDLTTDGRWEIYSAATDATGTQIMLNNPASTGQNVLGEFAITPDSARVIYGGDLTAGQGFEVYSASTFSTGTQITLSDAFGQDGGTGNPKLAPDGMRVVYRGDLANDRVFELYSAGTRPCWKTLHRTDE